MKRSMSILLVALMGCTAANLGNGSYRSLRLDFKNCRTGQTYAAIALSLPVGFTQEKTIDDHGFCEFRFNHSNGTTLYISSNIYDGSSLNYQNRLETGIETYSSNREKRLDVKNNGSDSAGNFWMEWVRGSYVIGYINNPKPDSAEVLFKDIELIRN